MEIIRDTKDFKINMPTAVCIGKFDGVHIGHQKLLKIIAGQKQRGLSPAVFTFDPSPEELFTGRKIEALCTKEAKEEMFEHMGIDIVVEFPLDMESAAMEPEDFVREVLIERMNMRYIAAGSDISFGRGGKGDRALIEQLSRTYGFECVIINKVLADGEEVSSTRIRKAVADGQIGEAKRLLGRVY
ncbi:MAG: FAD synthetase family protein [Lachnospiraceae bacterium]|nr:FAD synthetase family protein [Lachnospiraceae bacterium]